MALRGFAVNEIYDDFVFAEYIDIDNGYIKHESGLVTVDTSANKTWRKARVIKVGPHCRETHIGDIVLFPNDKGLQAGEVEYIENDEVKRTKNAIFLGEHRIFATLKHVD